MLGRPSVQGRLSPQGLPRTPSALLASCALYLAWLPSTSSPPRPFSWSTSWRSFSISSDRRPCARQTGAGGGGRAQGGTERGDRVREGSRAGEKQKGPRKVPGQTQITLKDEVQLE